MSKYIIVDHQNEEEATNFRNSLYDQGHILCTLATVPGFGIKTRWCGQNICRICQYSENPKYIFEFENIKLEKLNREKHFCVTKHYNLSPNMEYCYTWCRSFHCKGPECSHFLLD